MTQNNQLIPTNLISGFLGSGKTTAILHLLCSRPANARWAVLVNEFGDVGIDGSILEQQGLDDGIFIKEVPGGCICCAAGLPLQIALNLLIKKANPQRILIEPTGIGHPKKVLDILQGEFYNTVLDIRAVICLVEAYKLNEEKYLNNETFIDQLNIADVVLASKSDLASKDDLQHFYQFVQSFVIAKEHIDTIEFGQFSISLLDIKHNISRCAVFPDAHTLHQHEPGIHSQDTGNKEKNSEDEVEDNFQWQRFENHGQGYSGCGWIFHCSIVFDEIKVTAWVNSEAFTRVKGIFHTDNGWVLLNRTEQQFSKQVYEQSKDSRVEIIELEKHDWNQVEEQILACIKSE